MRNKSLFLAFIAIFLREATVWAQTEVYDFEAWTRDYYAVNEDAKGIDTKVFNSSETLQFNNNTYTILEERDGYADFQFGGRFAVEYSDDTKKGITSPRFEQTGDGICGLYNNKRWPKLVIMNVEVGDRITVDFMGDLAPRNSASALITDEYGNQVTDMLDAANKNTGSMTSGSVYTVSKAGHLPLYLGYGTSGVTIRKIVIVKNGLSDEDKAKAAALTALTEKIAEAEAELEYAGQEGLYGDGIFQYSVDKLSALDNAINEGKVIASSDKSKDEYDAATQAINNAISGLTINAPADAQAYSVQSTNGVGERYLCPTQIADGKAAMSDEPVGIFFAPVSGVRNQFYIFFQRDNKTCYMGYDGTNIVELTQKAANGCWLIKPQTDGAIIIAKADDSAWIDWPNSTAEQTNTLNNNTWNNQWRVEEYGNLSDGIGEVVRSSHEGTGFFDLSGCRLPAYPTKKGLYINNGKKIIIK